MTLPHNVRVAVVQAAPVAFDRECTLAKVRSLTLDAGRRGAKLVVFPEAFVSAYPRGMTFGAVVGDRTPEGRDWYRRYWESSVDVPGSVVDDLGAIAAEAETHLVIGVIERDGGTLYCTVLFFGPDGYLGKHRKLVPTASERLVWGQGDGSTMPVFATPIGKLGAAICWESYMPLYRTALYAKGVQLYLAPTADSRDGWLASMRHIALEGRCFVLSCNQFARRSDYPPDYPGDFTGGGRHRDPRWQLYRQSARRGRCRARIRRGSDPHGGHRSGRYDSRQVRPRRGGPLRAPGRLPATCERKIRACAGRQPSVRYTYERNRAQGPDLLHAAGCRQGQIARLEEALKVVGLSAAKYKVLSQIAKSRSRCRCVCLPRSSSVSHRT